MAKLSLNPRLSIYQDCLKTISNREYVPFSVEDLIKKFPLSSLKDVPDGEICETLETMYQEYEENQLEVYRAGEYDLSGYTEDEWKAYQKVSSQIEKEFPFEKYYGKYEGMELRKKFVSDVKARFGI